MSKKTKELSFEERTKRLQAIVGSLENGERPLEESVALYKEGLAHTLACRELLARAKHEIELCDKDMLGPFDGELAGDGDDSGN